MLAFWGNGDVQRGYGGVCGRVRLPKAGLVMRPAHRNVIKHLYLSAPGRASRAATGRSPRGVGDRIMNSRCDEWAFTGGQFLSTQSLSKPPA